MSAILIEILFISLLIAANGLFAMSELAMDGNRVDRVLVARADGSGERDEG